MAEQQTSVSRDLTAARSAETERRVGAVTAPARPARARMLDAVRSLVREGIILRGPGAGLRLGTQGISLGYFLGTVDRVEQEALLARLKGGDVFYDIGANVGVYTVLGARRVGPAGKVVAFEPFPASAEAMRQNCIRNDLSNVTLVQAAVAERSGEIEFQIGSTSVVNRIGDAASSPTGETLTVPMVAIDDYVQQSGAPLPNVVVVDVEQAEVRVLEGMRGTIERARPTLFIEVHWLGTDFTDFVKEKIVPLGYRATTLAGEPLPTDLVRYHAILTPEV
jgi:FkbM family methyltransferase